MRKMSLGQNNQYILELSPNPIQFEPVTKITNVFYDEVTKQVFTVRSGGATGVNVKGPCLKTPFNFRIEDKGPLLSIKFSPDQQILAVQRSAKSVEFLNFVNQLPDGIEYSQPCRGTSATILNFVWVSNVDFIIVTNQGLEHYQITPERRTVKSVKSHSLQPSNWFVYCPISSLLLVSSGALGNILHPYLFKNQQLLRLPKFEVEIPAPHPQPPRLCLFERDVYPTALYNQTVVLILRHQTKSNSPSGSSEIHVYTLSKDAPPRKTHILHLDANGKFAISIVNNLVVVHHQPSKTSSIFDTNFPGESDGRHICLNPFLSCITIRPYFFHVPASPVAVSLVDEPTNLVGCDMYSPNWVFFQPNIIIDAILGCLWSLELHLPPVVDLVDNPVQLFDFLLQRQDSKATVLSALRRLICSLSPSDGTRPGRIMCDISAMGRVFDRLNEAYRNMLDIEIQSQIAQPATSPLQLQSRTSPVLARPTVVVDQNDLFSRVITPLMEHDGSNESLDCSLGLDGPRRDRLIVSVVNEYVRSLVQFHIPVQHFVYEMLIESFVRLGQFYQLHQLFQYHAVTDSKPLACLLLSLESVYPAAYQLALDMLKRISTANEEIVEILLSKNKVIAALRFARETIPKADECLSARKFLEAAQNSKDPNVFYGVYQFFLQRNLRLRGSPAFLKGEHCETYVRHFNALFATGGICDLSSNST